MTRHVLIVGAGASGMMAAITAARGGAQVTLFEKMRRPGSKLLITGKGRCNLTNAASVEVVVDNTPGNGRFLFPGLHRFGPDDTVRFFAEIGVPTKVERGGRVFPRSDRARDVVDALCREMTEHGVDLRLNSAVAEIIAHERQVQGVKLRDGTVIKGHCILLAAGGASYPGTGSEGDGFRLASALGHVVHEPIPSLVPLETREAWVSQVSGLSLRNIEASVISGGSEVGREFGELLFTKFGLSGPIILTLSRDISHLLNRDSGRQRQPGNGASGVTVSVDLKPALIEEQLDERLLRDFSENQNRYFRNSLDALLPQSLIPIIIDLSGIEATKRVHSITRDERLVLARLLKGLKLTVTRTRPLAEAVVTCGGIEVSEIDPRSCQSKIISGLYAAGEVLDVDALTGGFNLQVAFTTGFLAGTAMANADCAAGSGGL